MRIDTNAVSPVEARADAPATARRIGAKIGGFSAAGAVLAGSDLITTLPTFLMASEMETRELRALRPAVTPERFRVRFVRSARPTRDPGNLRLRRLVKETHSETQDAANARVAAQLMEIPPWPG